jgi:hypothetical protein
MVRWHRAAALIDEQGMISLCLLDCHAPNPGQRSGRARWDQGGAGPWFTQATHATGDDGVSA